MGTAVKNNNFASAVGMAIWEGFRIQRSTRSSMLCYAYITTYVKTFFGGGGEDFMLLMSRFLECTHVTFVFPYVFLQCSLDLRVFPNIETFPHFELFPDLLTIFI
jgi:hypothetical protein